MALRPPSGKPKPGSNCASATPPASTPTPRTAGCTRGRPRRRGRRLQRVERRHPRRPAGVTHRRRQRHRHRTEHPSPRRTDPRRARRTRSASALHDDTTAGVGDVIVTRANRRDLRTSSGAWVRNGDLWTVLARDDDGSLLVQRNHRAGVPQPASVNGADCPLTTSRSTSNSVTPPPRTAPKG